MKTALITLLLSTMIFPFQSADKRKVLLFSTDKSNATLLQQQQILHSDAKGIEERDISIETYILNEQNKDVFIKHKISGSDFMFILVGKDGGEKLRSKSVVTNRKLFGLIDEMPMRRSEMKKQ